MVDPDRTKTHAYYDFCRGYDRWSRSPKDCHDFFYANYDDLRVAATKLSWQRLGEDFYLTRHRHGAGYWDDKFRGAVVDAALDRLTKAAHVYGSSED